MEFSPLAVMLLLISLIPVAHAQEKPKPTVRVNPQSSVYTGDTITLTCELQSTGWEIQWYKNNPQLQPLYSEQANTLKMTVNNAGETEYKCRACRRNQERGYYYYHYYCTELSDPVRITVRERPGAVLSVSPQSWLTEGDSVTLSCEVTDSSTDWTFSWYTAVPYRDGLTQIKHNHGYIMYVELLSDSSRGSGGKYTLSPAALNHTGVYMCRGERGEPALHTQYSNPQTLWITGESPPVSLIINPSKTQHFTKDSLSLSCEDQINSTRWRVRRYTHSEGVLDCSRGSVTGSTCEISFLSTSHTGVYWCESESGENSNPVNITVHDGDVILESPVHPVTEGHPLTLRCLYRYPNSSNLRADFYKDGSVLQTQTTGEMIIRTVSKSDEGFYHCKHQERRESPKSWVSVRGSRASAGTVGVAVGLGFLFIALLILMILLWSYKRKKENQTSEQNQIRSGAEDSQSGHTPLQAGSEHIYAAVDQTDTSGTGEAAAESREATYAQVTKKKKTNRNNGADAEPGVTDVTYAEIELKPMTKAKRMKEKTAVGDDTVYSVLQQKVKLMTFIKFKRQSIHHEERNMFKGALGRIGPQALTRSGSTWGYIKEEPSNQAGTISHRPSPTVDLIQPAESTENIVQPPCLSENTAQHPCSADDATQSPCSAEDVAPPSGVAKSSAFLPCSSLDVTTQGSASDITPPAYSTEDIDPPSCSAEDVNKATSYAKFQPEVIETANQALLLPEADITTNHVLLTTEFADTVNQVLRMPESADTTSQVQLAESMVNGILSPCLTEDAALPSCLTEDVALLSCSAEDVALLSCSTEDVALSSCSTEADNRAIWTAPASGPEGLALAVLRAALSPALKAESRVLSSARTSAVIHGFWLDRVVMVLETSEWWEVLLFFFYPLCILLYLVYLKCARLCSRLHQFHVFVLFSDPVPFLVLISLIQVSHPQEKPKLTVRVNPQSSVYTGHTITLTCELQSTGWEFYWYKYNQYMQLLDTVFTDTNTLNMTVNNAEETVYMCLARRQSMLGEIYTELSDPVKITERERPGAVLSVSPQSWLTEGDSVTLSCEVTDSSTDWKFSWYTTVPYRDALTQIKDTQSYIMHVKPLSDSSRGSGGNYTLSPAALNHTGVYMCRGERREPALHTQYSNPQPLWITGESPPVSLIINPSRAQHFTTDSLSLSCEGQRNSTGWTVRQYTYSERVLDCSRWGLFTGSTCKIIPIDTYHTGVYWCESESGGSSNPINVTVHDGDVILESPVHPVTEGHPLTLRCLYRYTKSSNLQADFYKDGSVLQTQTTGEMIIRTVSKSDEGFYHCKHPERGVSPKSWVSVRRSRSSGRTTGVGVGVSLAFFFTSLWIIFILLSCIKRKKENQQDTNQTSEQNQSQSGAEDSQSGHTPLQAGADAEPSVSFMNYADLDLQPLNKEARVQVKASVGNDTVYSDLKLNME
ncbi:uncharacterized protein LOC128610748 [Ictalurus furcatus]|uniref:uncharacterized protein LOC128610748 n=1 Tax=Ictalurus furcatus TaxID=66913 RepID=UPI00235092D8|nr:uncharacterized protein LOC128610748 [Ictalurus furcatus]